MSQAKFSGLASSPSPEVASFEDLVGVDAKNAESALRIVSAAEDTFGEPSPAPDSAVTDEFEEMSPASTTDISLRVSAFDNPFEKMSSASSVDGTVGASSLSLIADDMLGMLLVASIVEDTLGKLTFLLLLLSFFMYSTKASL